MGGGSLPAGDSYPIFEGYPRRAVDFAARERERIAGEEAAIARRKQLVRDLSQKTDALSQIETAWEAEKGRLAALELSRR